MKLTLIVVEAPEQSNMANHTKVFEKNGTIGRSEKSTWVLPDTKRVLSSNHLHISVDGDQCTVTDTSTNGTSLNEANNLLSKQTPHPLNNGDVIIVGEYKLKAVIDQPQQSAAAPSNGSVLDNYDKTTFATSESASRSQLEKNAEGLDKYLDSSQPSQPLKDEQGGWAQDFGASNFGSPDLGDQANLDPLASPSSSQQTPNFGFESSNSDSLGLNDQRSGFSQDPSPQWNQNDDWWKDGSSSDQSPLINERVNKFKVEEDPFARNQSDQQNQSFAPNTDNHAFTANTPQDSRSNQQPADYWGNNSNQNPALAPAESGLGIDDDQPGFVPKAESSTTANPNESFGFNSPPNINQAPEAAPQFDIPQQTASIDSAPSNAEQQWYGSETNQASSPPFGQNNAQAPFGANAQPEAPQNFYGNDNPHVNSHPPQTSSAPYESYGQNPHPGSGYGNTPHPNARQQHPGAQFSQQGMPTHPAHSQQQAPQDSAKELAKLLTLEWSNVTRPEDLLSDSAAMITETIRRLMDLLRARSAVKNELRVERTMIETVNNNPLKFTTDTSDALNIIFEKQGRSYMSPKETIEDSFDDLSDHQIAVLAGMQSAYDAMFRYFHPSNLERIFKNKNNLFSNKNAMNWESFVTHYEELANEKEQTYARIFGEHFAVAYEKQLSELKSARSFTNQNRNT